MSSMIRNEKGSPEIACFRINKIREFFKWKLIISRKCENKRKMEYIFLFFVWKIVFKNYLIFCMWKMFKFDLFENKTSYEQNYLLFPIFVLF